MHFAIASAPLSAGACCAGEGCGELSDWQAFWACSNVGLFGVRRPPLEPRPLIEISRPVRTRDRGSRSRREPACTA